MDLHAVVIPVLGRAVPLLASSVATLALQRRPCRAGSPAWRRPTRRTTPSPPSRGTAPTGLESNPQVDSGAAHRLHGQTAGGISPAHSRPACRLAQGPELAGPVIKSSAPMEARDKHGLTALIQHHRQIVDQPSPAQPSRREDS